MFQAEDGIRDLVRSRGLGDVYKRQTVFLPETDFPMRAGLPQREPDWLARWERIGVYDLSLIHL